MQKSQMGMENKLWRIDVKQGHISSESQNIACCYIARILHLTAEEGSKEGS